MDGTTSIDGARAGAGALGSNLLRKLRAADLEILRPALQDWPDGERGAMLYRPGDTVEHAYFPCGPALVSFKVTLHDGREVETALVGREGAVGGIVSQGHLPAFARAEVQFPGPFLRLGLAELDRAKARSPAIARLFARYADCLMAQVFQGVACNAVHTIEQRAAKWLVAAIDRTGDDRVPLTQEQLGRMLGVGRSYVARVLRALKAAGVVETRRGGLRVRDLGALQARSCECHAAVRQHFDEVLKGVYPREADATAGVVLRPERWRARAGGGAAGPDTR
jgi:CRP-like cAMP-binding protein